MLTSLRNRLPGSLPQAAAFTAITVAAFATVAAGLKLDRPSVALVPLGLIVVGIGIARLGLVLSALVTACIISSVPGAIQTILGITGGLTPVGSGLVLLVGAVGAFKVKLPKPIALSIITFLVISTAMAVPAVFRSADFAFRSWTALNLPWAALVSGIFAVTHAPARIGVDRSRKILLAVIILGLAVNAVYAIRQAFVGLTPAEIQMSTEGVSTYRVGLDIRLSGAQRGNQDFALLMGCMAPALLCLALLARRWRVILWALTASLYLATFVSLTRTAVIASVAATVLVLALNPRASVTRRAQGFLGLLAGGLVTWWLLGLVDQSNRLGASFRRTATLFDLGGDRSFDDRVTSTLPYAWSVFESQPLGAGPGAAGPVSQLYPEFAPFGTVTSDNGYLMIAIQLGIIGVAAFVAALVGILAMLLARRQKCLTALPGAASIAALLVGMTLAGYWSLLAPISLIFVFVGVCSSPFARSSIESSSEPAGTPAADGLLLVRATGVGSL